MTLKKLLKKVSEVDIVLIGDATAGVASTLYHGEARNVPSNILSYKVVLVYSAVDTQKTSFKHKVSSCMVITVKRKEEG